MADENTRRSFRSNDPYRQAAEAPRPDEQSSDPLAELARLIGRADPFAELGRNQPRQQESPEAARNAPAPHDDWRHGSARDDYASRDAQNSYQDSYREPYQDSQREAFQDDSRYGYGAEGRRQDAYDDNRFQQDSRAYQDGGQGYDDGPQQLGRGYDDRHADGHEHGQHYAHGDEADQYYQDDDPLAPDEDEMYDDAPRARRRGGLVTALALMGCAMLGTAGAYAYRSYSGPGSPQAPPVITADSTTPTKITPANADQQPSKAIQDRLANAGKEQLVPKQEEPVALKDIGNQSSSRGVLPAPAAPVPGGLGGVSTEPRKIRTERIRPDGNDTSSRPVGTLPPAATTRSAAAPAPAPAAPAPKAAGAPAPARSGGPVSLDPQTGEPPAPAPADRGTRSAALPTRAAPEPASTSGGFVVQLSSQKSEGEAQASFRTLQAKFPNELGSRQPIIRRADLGSKGVVYRALVGGFASSQEATQFCTSYKAAGGQCFIPKD